LLDLIVMTFLVIISLTLDIDYSTVADCIKGLCGHTL
jgi:hypothetical protein